MEDSVSTETMVSELSKSDRFLMARRFGVGWFVLIASLFLFFSTGTYFNGGDTRGNMDLSYWLAEGHGFNLVDHPRYAGGEPENYWTITPREGFVGVYFPGGLSLYGTVGFATARFAGFPITMENSPLIAKVIASVLMAIAIWCIWYCVMMRYGDTAALIVAVFLAAGSPVYAHFSQAFWVQTGALFSQAIALALIIFGTHEKKDMNWREAIAVGGAGFFGTYSFFCRPTFAPFVFLFAVFAFWLLRKRSWIFIIGMAMALAVGIWINMNTQLSPLGIYLTDHAETQGISRVSRMLRIFAALLVSPMRGVFVFMPWTILTLISAILFFWKKKGKDTWFLLHFIFILSIFAILSKHKVWFGGSSHGPRLQSDALFSAACTAAPLIGWLHRRVWGWFVLAALLFPSLIVYHNAARMPRYHWEQYNTTFYHSTWDWTTGDFAWYWTRGKNLRDVMGEKRNPLLSPQGTIEPGAEDSEKYIDYGFTVRGDSFHQMVDESALLFSLPEGAKDINLFAVIRFLEPDLIEDEYALRIKVNDEPVGTFSYIPGRDNRIAAVFIDKEILSDSENEISFKYDNAPRNEAGKVYLSIQGVVFVPETEKVRTDLKPIMLRTQK